MTEFSVAVLSMAACVFAASVTAKLRGRSAYRLFRAGLRETGLLAARLLPAVAAVLAAAEAVTAAGTAAAAVLVTATGSAAKPTAETVLAVATVLTAVLASGVAVVARRGTRATCACFGAPSGRPLSAFHLIRNLALLTVLAAGAAASALGHGRPAPAIAVLAAVAGSVGALVFIRWDDLAGLFTPIPAPLAGTPAAPETSRGRN